MKSIYAFERRDSNPQVPLIKAMANTCRRQQFMLTGALELIGNGEAEEELQWSRIVKVNAKKYQVRTTVHI